jgi:hypothetical protein
MLRLPSAGLLIFFATVGCASQSSKNAEAGPDEAHNPSWLVGNLRATNRTATGQVQIQDIELRADGSATDSWRSFASSVPAVDLADSADRVDWSLDGTSLRVDNLTHTMNVAANCHLVQLDDRVFTHVDPSLDATAAIAGCPQTEAPLTTEETAFLGAWSYSDDDGGHIFMYLDADRRLSVTLGWTEPVLTTFSIDPDGTLHGRTPDGVEVFNAKVSKAGNAQVRWCEGKDCMTFHR